MAEQTESVPCGLYRTLADIGSIPAGRLAFYHNHGERGPGLFLPSGWRSNRAEFRDPGECLPQADARRYLEPLPAQGFYRVHEAFYCCDKKCQRFEAEALVQLAYGETGEPILFVPEWREGRLELPEGGMQIDLVRVEKLAPLTVPGYGASEGG